MWQEANARGSNFMRARVRQMCQVNLWRIGITRNKEKKNRCTLRRCHVLQWRRNRQRWAWRIWHICQVWRWTAIADQQRSWNWNTRSWRERSVPKVEQLDFKIQYRNTHSLQINIKQWWLCRRHRIEIRLNPAKNQIKVEPMRCSTEQAIFLNKFISQLHKIWCLKPTAHASWQAALHLVQNDSPSKFRIANDLRPVDAPTKKIADQCRA